MSANIGQEHAALPKDPNAAASHLLSTIGRLSAVYERENEALRKADTHSFFELQEEKLQAARLYEFGVKEFLNRKDDIKKVNPDLQIKLKESQGKFSTLATQNRDALSRMQRSVERLGNTLRNAARDAARKNRVYSYGETGRVDDELKKPISTGLSETA